MVEKLLKLLVDEVDHELFQGVEVEDLKTSDIQYTDEVDLYAVSALSIIQRNIKSFTKIVISKY